MGTISLIELTMDLLDTLRKSKTEFRKKVLELMQDEANTKILTKSLAKIVGDYVFEEFFDNYRKYVDIRTVVKINNERLGFIFAIDNKFGVEDLFRLKKMLERFFEKAEKYRIDNAWVSITVKV